VPVIADFLAEQLPCSVLAAHGVLWRDRMDRPEQLRLLGAHGIGIE
jgi:hypothetical protein